MESTSCVAGFGAALMVTAAAAQGPSGAVPSIRVLVVNGAAVSVAIIADAERHATMVYRTAEVDVVWFNDVAAVLADGRPVDFTVMLLSPKNTALMAANAGLRKDETLGFAATSPSSDHGHVAYGFFGRIEYAAGRYHLPVASLLGEVIAHELGHLLLGHNNHSDVGLMRGTWELRSAMPDHFTKAQAAAIHQYLQTRRRGET